MEKQLIDRHNIVGKSFGSWIVLECIKNSRCKARCSCGNESIKSIYEVMHLRSTKCVRCRRKEVKSKGVSAIFGYTTQGYYGDVE